MRFRTLERYCDGHFHWFKSNLYIIVFCQVSSVIVLRLQQKLEFKKKMLYCQKNNAFNSKHKASWQLLSSIMFVTSQQKKLCSVNIQSMHFNCSNRSLPQPIVFSRITWPIRFSKLWFLKFSLTKKGGDIH